MAQFTDIIDKLIRNYTCYLKTQQTHYLEENIRLFASVHTKELKSSLANASTPSFIEMIKGLLIIGKTYNDYAHSINNDKTFEHLNNALTCFRMAESNIYKLPPYNIDPAISNQQLEATFAIKLTRFYIAEQQFKLLNPATNSKETLPKLDSIRNTLKSFTADLKGTYKDKGIREQLLIDNVLIQRVKRLAENLTNFQGQLLTAIDERTPKRKAPELSLPENKADAPSSAVTPEPEKAERPRFFKHKKQLTETYLKQTSQKPVEDEDPVLYKSEPTLTEGHQI